MAEALSAEISASLLWLFQDTLGLTTIADSSRLEFDAQLSDGTGAGEANVVWHDLRTVSAGTNDDLLLSALPQTIFGNAVSVDFASVKGLLIVNTATTSGDGLIVGAAPTDTWAAPFGGATHQVRVPSDSCERASSHTARDRAASARIPSATAGGTSAHSHARAGAKARGVGRSNAINQSNSVDSWQHRQTEMLQRIDENVRRLVQMAESQRQTPSAFTEPEN